MFVKTAQKNVVICKLTKKKSRLRQKTCANCEKVKNYKLDQPNGGH